MPDNDRPFDLEFPLGGINVAGEYQEQPAGTTPIATNVRGMNPDSRRERGGSRAGLIRYIPGPLFTGADAIQHLNVIVDPTGAAFQSEFEVPDIDWVEDPLNPGTFVPPGGWGYPTGAAPHEESGSGMLSIVAAMTGEGQTGTDPPTCTEWELQVTMTPGFGDVFNGFLDMTYCDCADPDSIEIDTVTQGLQLASPSDLESADAFADWLLSVGIGTGNPADMFSSFDRTPQGGC